MLVGLGEKVQAWRKQLKMGSFEIREGCGRATKLFKLGGGCLVGC